VADDLINIVDGESHCRIVDPTAGTLQVPLVRIGQQGALVDTRMQFEPQAAVDLTVVLKGLSPRQFFATVAFSDKAGLHLQWMPIDAGEQTRLHSLLEAYKTLHASKIRAAAQAEADAEAPEPKRNEKTATRRVIKPKSSLGRDSSTAIEPFAEPPKPPPSPSADSGRVGTRRVVRPSQRNLPAQPDQSDNTPGTLSIFREETAAQNLLPETPVELTPFGNETVNEPTTPGSKTAIIGNDGRMDIGASIRSKAKSVRASDLAARHDRVRVLNMGTIKSLIQEAVEEAAGHLTRALGEQDRKRLLEEAEEGFKERLKMFEAEKLTAEMKSKQLADQLRVAQDLLESERKRTIKADQFTVSAAGLDEIEAKFKRLLDHSIAEGRVIPALEEELRRVIGTVFESERQRIREQEMQAQNEKIQLLESKIKRLASSLDETERQRDEMQEWANALEASGGGALRNIMSAGMKDDANKKRKLALMKEILDVNRQMRAQLGIATNAVDDETAEAIKKAEAEAKLTPEEEAEIRASRKRIDEDPKDKPAKLDAEALNVLRESGVDVPDEPITNPDDEAWEKPAAVKAAAGMKRVTASGEEEVAEGADINPDDMEWSPTAAVATGESDSGIKKIAANTDFKLPPLEKKGKKK
jgi:hypothetical protein